MTQKSEENWCLVCSGSVFGEEVLITGKKAEKLRHEFHKVLKAHVPKKPPVENICKKCDRNIRRLAESSGETAEREIEYMRKTYRKTVQEYNAKADLRRQKLRKAAEAFMLGKPKEQQQTENKISTYATKWKFRAKSGVATSKISLPGSSGSSSPSWSKPASGETTPVIDFKHNWINQLEFHMPVDETSDKMDEMVTLNESSYMLNYNSEKMVDSSDKLNGNSRKWNENSDKLNRNLPDSVTGKLDEDSDRVIGSYEDENCMKLHNIPGKLNENVKRFDENFDKLVENSAKLKEKMSKKVLIPHSYKLIKNSVEFGARKNKLECNPGKSNEIPNNSNDHVTSTKLDGTASPSESKAALIENEGGVDNVESTSITVNIGGKTDDGAGVKGENVKLNVKDGGVKSSTEGGDDNTANDDVSSTTTDGSSISNVVISTTGDGGDASKDDKKSDEKDHKNKTDDKKDEKKDDKKDEKKDDKKAEKKDGKKAEKNDGKTDDKNANTDGGKSEVKDEKVKSVKDVVKEIEGEDGGSEKSTVNGTVMKSDKKSVKGGSDQAKDPSKEKSPLIEKESNVKDTGPGVLCCSIL